MFARIVFAVGVLMSITAAGAVVLGMKKSEPLETAIEQGANSPSPETELAVAVEEPDVVQIASAKVTPSAKEEATSDWLAKPDTTPKSIADFMVDVGQADAKAAALVNTETESEAPSLTVMVERCFLSILDHAKPSGEGLKLTGNSVDWEKPKPSTAMGFEVADRSRELYYGISKADTPDGEKRACSVSAGDVTVLGHSSFYPEFSAWWTAGPAQLGFDELKVSPDAFWDERDIVYKWRSRTENARDCPMNVTYVERYSSDSVELTIVISEHADGCAKADGQGVRVSRLPQISNN